MFSEGLVSDIAVSVLKRYVKLQPTNLSEGLINSRPIRNTGLHKIDARNDASSVLEDVATCVVFMYGYVTSASSFMFTDPSTYVHVCILRARVQPTLDPYTEAIL